MVITQLNNRYTHFKYYKICVCRRSTKCSNIKNVTYLENYNQNLVHTGSISIKSIYPL